MPPLRSTLGSVLALAAGLVLLEGTAAAQAQRNMPTPVTGEGQINGLTTDKMRVVTPEQNLWMVHFTKATSVMFTGPTDLSALRPGVFVKFQVQVDQHCKPAAPVEAVEIFTPTQQEVFGAFPRQTGSGSGEETDSKSPPVETPKTPKRPVKTKKRPVKTPKKAKAPQKVSTYDIVGRVVSGRGTTMKVNFLKGSLTVELAEDAKVQIAVADIRYVRLGDRVAFTGFLVGPESGRTATATSLQITRPVPDKKPDDKKDKKGDATEDDKTEELVKLLTPKRTSPAKETFKVSGYNMEFKPARRQPVSLLLKRFGKVKKYEMPGVLTVRGREKSVKWYVYRWGRVIVIADRSRKSRFFHVKAPPAEKSDKPDNKSDKPDSKEKKPAPPSKAKPGQRPGG
jgi:hypothetical protein